MERRLVVAGLTALLAGGAAAGPADADAEESVGLAPGQPERHFIDRTRAAAALSLSLSRLAARRGDDDDVKEFVQFEVREQETILDILHSLEHPGLPPGKINVPSDVEVAGLLEATAKDVVQKLDRQKTGSPFDQAYVRLQIEGHRQLLDIQTDYLVAGRHAVATTLAKLTRATTQEHATLLGDIDAALGRD